MIKYPLLANTNAAKFAFVKRGRELLRREHNIIGKWFNEGLTLTEYQKLRAAVQITLPYHTGLLPKEDRERYLDDRFKVKTKILNQAEGALKELLYSSARFSCNLDDDIK